MEDFKNAINTKAIDKLSLKQLEALNKLLDGKATEKDKKILRGGK